MVARGEGMEVLCQLGKVGGSREKGSCCCGSYQASASCATAIFGRGGSSASLELLLQIFVLEFTSVGHG
jgi:hypothetical protein